MCFSPDCVFSVYLLDSSASLPIHLLVCLPASLTSSITSPHLSTNPLSQIKSVTVDHCFGAPPPPKTHSAYSAFEICSSFCKILPIHSYGDIFNQCIQQFHSKSPQLSAFIFFTNTDFLVKILIQTASSVCLITCDLPDTCVAYSIFA